MCAVLTPRPLPALRTRRVRDARSPDRRREHIVNYEDLFCRIETIIISCVVKLYKYMLNRITIDPEVMSGQPCIRGLRIPVPFILRLLASGKTISQILKDYPDLEEEDIRQALSFASWATTEKTIPVTA